MQFRRLVPDLVIVTASPVGSVAQETVRRIRSLTLAPLLVLIPTDSQSMFGGVLDSGADDCMSQPFQLEELAARARRLLHRSSALGGRQTVATGSGPIDIDPVSRTARQGGKDLGLTRKEFDLFLVLLKGHGTTISHQEIIGHVWGGAADNARQNLRRVVSSLRRKIELDPVTPAHLISVRGGGYRLAV